MPGGHVPQPGQQHDVLEGELRVGQADRQLRQTAADRARVRQRLADGGAELHRLGGEPPVHQVGVGQARRRARSPSPPPRDAYAPVDRPARSESARRSPRRTRPGRCPARSRRAPRPPRPRARAGPRAGAPAAGPGCARRPADPAAPGGSRAARRPSAARSACVDGLGDAWWPGGWRSGPPRRRCWSRARTVRSVAASPGSWVSTSTRFPSSRPSRTIRGSRAARRRTVRAASGGRARLSTCWSRPGRRPRRWRS